MLSTGVGAFPTVELSGRGLTLIMALEVMRKSVARSLTCLILSVLSGGRRRASSSLRERCRAVPCLAIRSLQVLRSSTLLDKIRSVFCSSVLSVCDTDSSPESSVGGKGTESVGLSWHARSCLWSCQEGHGGMTKSLRAPKH